MTRRVLPALAGSRDWPIRADHCFQRVLLDGATGGVWYDAIAGRPAYRFIATGLLRQAVELGRGVASGDVDLGELNRRSLLWREERRLRQGVLAFE